VFPHSDGKRADSYIAKLARIATVRVVVWRGSTGIKRCGVALTSATTPAPVRNLSPSCVVSLSVATSFHTTSVGGTVSRLYMCKSVRQTDRLTHKQMPVKTQHGWHKSTKSKDEDKTITNKTAFLESFVLI